MSDLLDQILTPEVRMVLYLIVMCIVMVYILSIVYVTRDAQRRGAAVVGMVPGCGCTYCWIVNVCYFAS